MTYKLQAEEDSTEAAEYKRLVRMAVKIIVATYRPALERLGKT